MSENTAGLFTFDQLSGEAKETARTVWLHSAERMEEFREYILQVMKELFPGGTFHVHFSHTGHPEDGMNIGGSVSVEDIYTCIKNEWIFGLPKDLKNTFPEEDWDRIRACAATAGETELAIPETDAGLSDEHACHVEFAERWIARLQETDRSSETAGLIHRFQDYADALFAFLNRRFTQIGHRFLHKISDEEFAEIAEKNGWRFTGNGQLG